MNLSEIQKELLKSDFDKEKQNGLLQLIDLKINNDMEKVLNKMDGFNSELKRVEDKVDTKFSIILWAIGLLMTVIIALKFIK